LTVDKRKLKKVISSTFRNKEISMIERRFEALDEVNTCNIYRNWTIDQAKIASLARP
jgi:hypothetical protein